MAAGAATLARALEQAEAVLGRSAAAFAPSTTAQELAAQITHAASGFDQIVTFHAALAPAGLWTQIDDEALAVLGGNLTAARARVTSGPLLELSADDVATGLIVTAETQALIDTYARRAAQASACAAGGGDLAVCAQSALTMSSTPRTPALRSGPAFGTVVLGVALLGLAVGAVALYAQKRKSFLDGFYSPRPRRISATARSGAPRPGESSYDLEVE